MMIKHANCQTSAAYGALLILLALTTPGDHTALAAEPRVEYEPTWESLDQHATPQWLMDAKVGLFIYPPAPTQDKLNAFYLQRDGKQRNFKVVDPWTEVPWDAAEYAQFAVDAGARYIVFGIDPHNYFLAYPSKYADIDGSPLVKLGGPDSTKDYVGEMAAAIRARGLRFGIYRNYLVPDQNPYFMETTFELIDRYQPATMWFDEHKTKYPAERLRNREVAAYYYNHSAKQDEVAIEDALGDAIYNTRPWYTGGPQSETAEGIPVRYTTKDDALYAILLG